MSVNSNWRLTKLNPKQLICALALSVLCLGFFHYWQNTQSAHSLKARLTSHTWRYQLISNIDPELLNESWAKKIRRYRLTGLVKYVSNHQYSQIKKIKLIPTDEKAQPIFITIKDSGSWSMAQEELFSQRRRCDAELSNQKGFLSAEELQSLIQMFQLQMITTQHLSMPTANTLLFSELNGGSVLLTPFQ